MNVSKTPDSRFYDLEDYPFQEHYVEVDGLRMHYVEEGDPAAAPVLMLHGEPSWSYLYRHMIGVCAGAGHRVIAPDLIGFGKSDKPTARSDYTYQRHVDWMTAFVQALDLQQVTLFCQDWGSLIGLRVAAEHEQRFARIVVGNGGLPTASASTRLGVLNIVAFMTWRTFALYSPVLPVGRIVNAGCLRTLSPGERRAYDAPFPDAELQAGARAFPRLVPLSPRDPAIPANRKAWEALGRWQKPFLTTFGDRDPILGSGDKVLQRHVPGAQGQPHIRVRAGHFLQEDAGPQLAQKINELIASAR